MIRLNLLPIEQKKRLRLYFFQNNILFSGLFLVLLVLILILFLGGILMFLHFKYLSIGKEIMVEQSKIIQIETIKGIEKKIKELNLQLADLDKIQKNQSNFYEILSSVVADTLSGVRVSAIEIEGATKKITITGYSPTRENLLLIKKTLENSSKYKNIDFPISNLTNPKDINFRFGFTYE